MFLAVLSFLPLSVVKAQTSSGGNYFVQDGTIVTGGGTSSGGSFTTTGGAGQSVAGQNSTGGPFTVQSGFYKPVPFAPTAANVSVSGQVIAANGRGIFRARIMMTDSFGQIRFAMTNPFGFYRFTDIAAGQNYVVSISSKEFQFAQPTQILIVSDNIGDLNFTALP